MTQIKQLPWRIICSRSLNSIAETPFGSYVVQRDDDTNKNWSIWTPKSDYPLSTAHPSRDAAMQAAQDHWNAAISEAVVECDHVLYVTALQPGNPNSPTQVRCMNCGSTGPFTATPVRINTAQIDTQRRLNAAIYRLCVVQDSPNLNDAERELVKTWIDELKRDEPFDDTAPEA